MTERELRNQTRAMERQAEALEKLAVSAAQLSKAMAKFEQNAAIFMRSWKSMTEAQKKPRSYTIKDTSEADVNDAFRPFSRRCVTNGCKGCTWCNFALLVETVPDSAFSIEERYKAWLAEAHPANEKKPVVPLRNGIGGPIIGEAKIHIDEAGHVNAAITMFDKNKSDRVAFDVDLKPDNYTIVRSQNEIVEIQQKGIGGYTPFTQEDLDRNEMAPPVCDIFESSGRISFKKLYAKELAGEVVKYFPVGTLAMVNMMISSIRNGQIVKIIGHEGEHVRVEYTDGFVTFHAPASLSFVYIRGLNGKYQTVPAEESTKFKVGDYVKVSASWITHYGKTGRVTSVKNFGVDIEVQFSDTSCGEFTPNELELDEVKPIASEFLRTSVENGNITLQQAINIEMAAANMTSEEALTGIEEILDDVTSALKPEPIETLETIENPTNEMKRTD